MMFCRQPRCSNAISFRSNKKKAWLLTLSLIALTVWTGCKQTSSSSLPPEAFLVLGGHEERERFAATLARQHPDLPIWVSSGSPPDYVEQIFKNRGISSERLHLDYRASDTVTNFTTLVDELKAQGIDRVYLITSQNHMPRARAVGKIVFGSRGIAIEPIAVPSNNPPEPIEKCLRDSARSILWLTTGRTGAVLLQFVERPM